MIALVEPGIGDVYRAPPDAWNAVAQRVELALRAQRIGAQMTAVLPSFPQLVDACQGWRQALLPMLAGQAAELQAFAQNFIPRLRELGQATAALQPTDALPPLLSLQALSVLAMLRERAAMAGPPLNGLAAGLQRFATVNRDIDLEIERYQQALGAAWPPLADRIADIETRLGRSAGTWTALASDLDAAAAPGFALDTALLAQLDLEGALAGWTQIEADIASFLQRLPTLEPPPC